MFKVGLKQGQEIKNRMETVVDLLKPSRKQQRTYQFGPKFPNKIVTSSYDHRLHNFRPIFNPLRDIIPVLQEF